MFNTTFVCLLTDVSHDLRALELKAAAVLTAFARPQLGAIQQLGSWLQTAVA